MVSGTVVSGTTPTNQDHDSWPVEEEDQEQLPLTQQEDSAVNTMDPESYLSEDEGGNNRVPKRGRQREKTQKISRDTQTDSDSTSDSSKKRSREVFKKPDPVRPRRDDTERNLKIENSNLKATRKKDVERIQKDAETIRDNAETIRELREKLAEKTNETNESEEVQELAWRRLVKEDRIQALQMERHYSLSMTNGVPTHPHATRFKSDLGDFHPKTTSLNLEWSYKGQWQRVPKYKEQKGGPE